MFAWEGFQVPTTLCRVNLVEASVGKMTVRSGLPDIVSTQTAIDG